MTYSNPMFQWQVRLDTRLELCTLGCSNSWKCIILYWIDVGTSSIVVPPQYTLGYFIETKFKKTDVRSLQPTHRTTLKIADA